MNKLLIPNCRIIWDSGHGYEIGYFINPQGVMMGTCLVELCTGVVTGEVSHPEHQIRIYTDELVNELTKKYGYEKRFSGTF